YYYCQTWDTEIVF
nr:immunoglobulin light chain junction region [Macaca mulatta]MOW04543.1 immunoglobulin light chain junction region [Macaca mulatta]MOW05258.1 immunoglobulin light chain junction region [Macaca mulatta]MOW05987.1 immunoglobulin light chain junction region [Macaca mulatta]MOW06476.1 immunoglobulin light chain junction region [Macaca mulatta]